MANVFKRKSSPNWQMRYWIDGRRVHESSGTTSKRLALAILGKRQADVVEGKFLDKKLTSKITFAELCDLYMEKHGYKLKDKGLESRIKAFKDFFGNARAESLTRTKVEDYLIERCEKRGLKESSRNRHLATIRGVYNWGKQQQPEAHLPPLVSHNPCTGIKVASEQHLQRTRFLDADEVQALLDACSDEFRPLITTFLHTGCRRQELFNLKWSDVDFLSESIRIRNSKSGRPRQIPMSATLKAVLSYLPSRFKKGLVFPSDRTGRRLVDVKKQFSSTLQRAGIKDCTLHTLRHTYASTLVMNSVDLKTVSELLGHHSIRMSERYSHLSPSHKTRAVKKLDSAYKPVAKVVAAGNSVKHQSL